MDDRRPLKSRQIPIFDKLAWSCVRRKISPNTISTLSVLASGVGCLLLYLTTMSEGVVTRVLLGGAAACVQLRLLANLLDGMVAERGESMSDSGKLYNEAPDRISDILLIVGFGLVGQSPDAIVLGWACACMAVLAAYTRELARSIDAPPPFLGPMAKPQRMALLTLALVSLALLPTFWTAHWLDARSWGLVEACLALMLVGTILTCLRRWIYLLRFTTQSAGTDG
ncbi:MAG: CDP-alcohol phosphatidyltransferase family protein [Phycisphaerales bacterium JB043]